MGGINMNKKNSKKGSKTDWLRLQTMSDADIDFSDIEELGPEFFKTAKLRIPRNKKGGTIRIDQDILD